MDSLLQIGLSNAVVASFLALLALVVGSVCRRPAVVHGLWLLVLLKLVTPPLVRVPVPWPVSVDSSHATASRAGFPTELAAGPPTPGQEIAPAPFPLPLEGVEDPPPTEFRISVDTPAADVPAPVAARPVFARVEVLALAWVLGSAGWFLLAGRRVARFQRLLRHARPAPPVLRNRVGRLARRLGLAECPGVWLVPGRVAPMLWAVGGPPRLLVPAELLCQVGPEQQDTLLLHELAHLRRHDHWVRALEFLALGLYWWHPAAWLARRQLREVEEQCCDAWVVSLLPGAGRAYALALVETLEFLSDTRPAVPLLASGIGQVSDLKRRLTMIMRGTTPRSLGWGSTLALFGLGALLLPSLPTWALGDDKKDDEKREIRVQFVTDEDSDGVPTFLVNFLDGGTLGDAPEDVKKIQAEVERLRADLQKKMAQLREAQAKMKAEAKAKGKVEDRKERVIRIEAGPDGGKKERVIRIEIVGGNITDEQLKDMLKGLEKTIPGAGRVIIDTDGVKPKEKKTPTPPTPPGVPGGPGPKPGAPGGGFGAGFPGGPGGAGGGFGGGRGMGGADPRIEKLEKRLDELMKELESLRKELKSPRGEGRRQGAGAGAPGQPGAEEARAAVAEALAKVGQHTGQVKAAEAQMEQAKAILDKAKLDKERLDKLFATGAVGKAELDQAHASYAQAMEQIKLLTAENQRAKKDLADFNAETRDALRDAQKSRQDAEKEIARLKRQLEELEARLKKEGK
jgi:beta-lactamase regulating signal transducer with metallopeptidase domain